MIWVWVGLFMENSESVH